MKRIFVFAFFLIFLLPAFAQNEFLLGTDEGLFDIRDEPRQIFKNIAIYKILHNGENWFFLTDKGILVSNNLQGYSFLNNGLPKKTLKLNYSGIFKFVTQTKALKDLEFHPTNKDIFVTATNDSVFLTVDGGTTWQNLGCYGKANGIKAVAVTDLPNRSGKPELTVFVSHSIYGVAWKQPFVSSLWHDVSNGLAKGAQAVDEVSDIRIYGEDKAQEIFAAQTFSGKLYRLNWKYNRFDRILNYLNDLYDAKCVDSLSVCTNYMLGLKDGDIFQKPMLVPPPSKNTKFNTNKKLQDSIYRLKLNIKNIFKNANCAWIGNGFCTLDKPVSLSELWLLNLDKPKSGNLKKACGKKGIYIPTYKLKNKQTMTAYFDFIKSQNLNMIVVDMKDDLGFVRYNSNNSKIKKVGGVVPLVQLEDLVAEAKARNIYLVARLIVFQDRQLYYYKNGKYAVKDYTTGNNWRGYKIEEDKIVPVSEFWVDPYNSDVWEYNTEIAEELVERGFDEIQFDYIRFPTGGDNMENIYYPAQQNGMDKESALISFLAFARSKISAPISIDIYGTNGWYRTGARTGARTGQEVEMLTDYVDVICPMYYPSHFSQGFLAYPPEIERPYRIYYQGCLRNKYIAKNKVIVRPWAQAFYIDVYYDKRFYNANYVLRQIIGIKNSIDEGYTYWNILGNYTDIKPDGTELK
ncbi:MAG: hypothetical protein CR988_00895 [Treponema sp.]|nr:MAG: hypothetical protein CR988_00895 [Treponema sp.]